MINKFAIPKVRTTCAKGVKDVTSESRVEQLCCQDKNVKSTTVKNDNQE